jgi:WXXGXW repeat (2 copies)
MRKLLQTLAISAVCLAPVSAARAQISFGIRIGEPPPPRAYRVLPQPGLEYVWVEGYWFPQGSHYRWHDGYWTRPPYEGAYWREPYYLDGRYFAGQWEGRRGYFAHDHRWDRDRERDERRFRRERERDRDRDERRHDDR